MGNCSLSPTINWFREVIIFLSWRITVRIMVSLHPRHFFFLNNHVEKQESVFVYKNFKKHKALKFIEWENSQVSQVFHTQIAKYSFNSSLQFSSGNYSMNKNSYLSHSIFESENLLRKVMEIRSFEIVFSPFRMFCLHRLLTLQEHLTTLTPGWISSYMVVMLLWI